MNAPDLSERLHRLANHPVVDRFVSPDRKDALLEAIEHRADAPRSSAGQERATRLLDAAETVLVDAYVSSTAGRELRRKSATGDAAFDSAVSQVFRAWRRAVEANETDAEDKLRSPYFVTTLIHVVRREANTKVARNWRVTRSLQVAEDEAPIDVAATGRDSAPARSVARRDADAHLIVTLRKLVPCLPPGQRAAFVFVDLYGLDRTTASSIAKPRARHPGAALDSSVDDARRSLRLMMSGLEEALLGGTQGTELAAADVHFLFGESECLALTAELEDHSEVDAALRGTLRLARSPERDTRLAEAWGVALARDPAGDAHASHPFPLQWRDEGAADRGASVAIQFVPGTSVAVLDRILVFEGPWLSTLLH